jgi:small nuclear ribonucleoprotein (snRNP)-like protein
VLTSVLMLGIGGMAVAQDRVTIMLRSGETVNGRFDGVSQGLFHLDVSDTDERKIPLGQVALIDLVGGASGLPETELSQARGSQHVLLLRNGSLTKGQLVTIEGARVSGNEDPAWVVFRAEGGEERRVRMSDVGRLYLGNYPGAAPATSTPGTGGTPSAGGVQTSGQTRIVTLPGNTQWIDTGLTVRQGDRLTVTATGEIAFSSDANDKASPNGSLRGARAAGAPLPDTLTGALIGRIGSGTPFGVGGNANFAAPGSGRLYLGVNDDNVGDNSGQFDIRVTPASTGDTTRRRR